VNYRDSPSARISFQEWGRQFQRLPDEIIQSYRYFRSEGIVYPWATYLFPPQTFAIYGSRHLRRLRFDNSLAALRLWGFVLGETERLFRARQTGKDVIATMGDLGATPPVVLAGGALPFYPDCTWWLPFMNESPVLFDAAARSGIGESACYSRAALGAFVKQAYFPRPVLCIAGTGASCDDYSSVEQLVESMGYPMFWLELPLRRDCGERGESNCERFATTPAGTSYQVSARELISAQFRALQRRLEAVLNRPIADAQLQASIRKVNRVRGLVNRIKGIAYAPPAAVFPALELMLIEFGNLHFYSDIDEWTAILEHVAETVLERSRRQQYLGPVDALRVVWVTPPADPLLLSYAEDLGLRIVGTEYVIAQALPEIPETGDPLANLAETFLNASLIGSSRARAQSVIAQAQRYQAEGVIISGILGGSHCAAETNLIRDYVQEALDLPVLAFDVPAPSGLIQSQIKTRIEAFVEVLRTNRGKW
jgi:hypothetical protein